MKVVFVDYKNPGIYEKIIPMKIIKELPEEMAEIILGLEEEDTAIGALAGHVEGVSFNIDSLFVAPEYRRRGGAKMLLQALRKIGISNMDEAVYEFTEGDLEEHGKLCEALEHIGFVDMGDSQLTIFATKLGNLKNTVLNKGESEFGTEVKPDDDYIMGLLDRFIGANRLPGPEGGMRSPDIDYELSRVYQEGDDIKSYLIVQSMDEDSITLGAAYNEAEPVVLMRMLQTVVQKAINKYPDDTDVYIQAVSKEASELVLNLMPGVKKLSHRYVFHMRGWTYMKLLEVAGNGN